MDESTFFDRDTHFTEEGMAQKDFEQDFERNFSKEKLQTLKENARNAITEVFIAFEARHGEEIAELGNKDMSRALYGVDVIVD